MEWLLERATSWESKARDLYAALAELFDHQTKARRFWQEMSNDESRHVDILLDIRNTIPKSRLSEHISEKQTEAALRIETLFKSDLAAHLATLDDAYELAHVIENSEMNAIFLLVAVASVADTQRDELVESQIDEHMERLLQFGREFRATYRTGITIHRTGSRPR